MKDINDKLLRLQNDMKVLENAIDNILIIETVFSSYFDKKIDSVDDISKDKELSDGINLIYIMNCMHNNIINLKEHLQDLKLLKERFEDKEESIRCLLADIENDNQNEID